MSLARTLLARCQRIVPVAVQDRARRHVLDWIGCVVGAANEPLAKTLAASVDAEPGAYPSFGIGHRSRQASVVYATALGNLLEMDDLARAALLHPGPVIVPTAIFCGLDHQRRYADVLEAIVYGYEAATRLGMSLDAYHYARWHPTTTVGIGAAAVTAARIMALNEDQTLAALGNALSVSGGLWHMRHHSVSTKQWHIVHAVLTGINSAAHAKLGFTASADTIEGEQGWHAVLARSPHADAISADGADGPTPWAIQSTSFKPWPACRHCHPAIDAALEIRASIDREDIHSIDLTTYADAVTFCDNVNPQDAQQARFSLQHCVAVALLNGNVRFIDFHDAGRSEPRIANLRAAITIGVDPTIEARYPQHFGAKLRVMLKSGVRHETTIADAKGDMEWPLTDAEITAKFHALWQWGLGDHPGADSVIASVLGNDTNAPLATILEDTP